VESTVRASTVPTTGGRPQWEYAQFVEVLNMQGKVFKRAVISLNGTNVDGEVESFRMLNEMGAEGWELVSILAVMPPSPTAAFPMGLFEYALKRQRRLKTEG
jgi:hypothetical protein